MGNIREKFSLRMFRFRIVSWSFEKSYSSKVADGILGFGKEFDQEFEDL